MRAGVLPHLIRFGGRNDPLVAIKEGPYYQPILNAATPVF
ncbi:MAG: hypothetical protein ACD_73C00435G0001 [uncultured bacterium]|nr:MAG: hypothetical protein ACD_73C00435G0001 [uncultured bacterium]